MNDVDEAVGKQRRAVRPLHVGMQLVERVAENGSIRRHAGANHSESVARRSLLAWGPRGREYYPFEIVWGRSHLMRTRPASCGLSSSNDSRPHFEKGNP